MSELTAEKPVIVVIHGAWHRPLHYVHMVSSLRAACHTVLAPALPSAGWAANVAGMTTQDDAKFIRAAMAPYLDAGRDVVVVCHSAGGMAATESIVGETVRERRARGQGGGVKAAVYLAAFAFPVAGMIPFESGGKLPVQSAHDRPEWWAPEGDILLVNDKGRHYLYEEVDEEVADIYMASLVPQSIRPFDQPCAHAASEIQAPITYILAQKDLCMAPEGQQAMATAAGAKIVTLDCGHSPFASEKFLPQLIDIITSAAEAPAILNE